MDKREGVSCGEAGDNDATAQSLLIIGVRSEDSTAVKQAFTLWRSNGLPWNHVRALAHGPAGKR